MRIIDDTRTRAEIESAISAHRAALAAHARTVGVPAPLADPIVDQLARVDEEWALRSELPPDPEPAPTLDDLKRARQVYINERREAAIASGAEFNGWRFDTDPNSIVNLTAAVTFIQAAPTAGLQVPATVSWRDADNIDRDLTPAQLIGLGAAIFAKVQAAHITARGLRDAITAARSVDAVMAIDWPA